MLYSVEVFGAAMKEPLIGVAGSPGPTWLHATDDCAGIALIAKLKMTDPNSAVLLISEGTAIGPLPTLHLRGEICKIEWVCTHLHIDENNRYARYQRPWLK